MRARAAAIVLALLLPIAGAAATPPVALVEGLGIVTASSHLCLHPPGPAAIHLMLTPDPGATHPIDRWLVAVEGSSAFGCPVTDATACTGEGRLGAGVDITGCFPLGGAGELGPVQICIPGPMAPPPVLPAHGTIRFDTALGSFDGELDLLLAGDAVADDNLCV